jgi:hypothetical protein
MVRISESSDGRRQQHFQFQLRELFVFVTVFAVVFAMMKWWGFQGFAGVATFVASLSATVLGIDYAIKKNLGW